MEVKLLMKACNYCGVNSFEDIFSLKKWANGCYCSLECVSKDIKQHEYLIKYYNNDIKATGRKINHLYEKHLSEEEVIGMRNEINKSLQKRNVLMKKLPCIKSLMKMGRVNVLE